MEDLYQKPKNNLSVSIAIVVAGGLIAAALYLSRGPAAPASAIQAGTAAPTTQTGQAEISIRPIKSEDHMLGNPAAPLALVVFTDLECPFCKDFHTTLGKVADTYGKNGSVLWVYRNFPLAQLHSRAPKEAEAAECADELGGREAYWAFVNDVFKTTTSNDTLDPAELPRIARRAGLDVTKFNACLSSGKYTEKVQADYDEAVAAGGQGTPFSVFVLNRPISDSAVNSINQMITTYRLSPDTFVFSNDKQHLSMSGALPYTMVQKVIDALLSK